MLDEGEGTEEAAEEEEETDSTGPDYGEASILAEEEEDEAWEQGIHLPHNCTYLMAEWNCSAGRLRQPHGRDSKAPRTLHPHPPPQSHLLIFVTHFALFKMLLSVSDR